MNRAERITSILTQAFSPRQLELRDDSHKHAGHAAARPQGETHYHVKIVAEPFSCLSKVKRHQAIYALLSEEFNSGLHALSIDARGPEDV